MKVMELKNLADTLETDYNNTTKYILPFLNDNIFNDITSEKNGFINAYTNDINRPWLNNHILLVYKYSLHFSSGIHKILNDLDNFHSSYTLRIKNVPYKVYAFTIEPNKKKEINQLKSGNLTLLLPSMKQQILDFWSGNPILFSISPTLVYNKDIESIEDWIPESDYAKKDIEI